MMKTQMKICALVLLMMLVGSSVLYVEASSDEQTENSGAGVEFDIEEEKKESPPKDDGKPKPGPGGGDGEVWSKLPQTGQVERAGMPLAGATILVGISLAFFAIMKLKRE